MQASAGTWGDRPSRCRGTARSAWLITGTAFCRPTGSSSTRCGSGEYTRGVPETRVSWLPLLVSPTHFEVPTDVSYRFISRAVLLSGDTPGNEQRTTCMSSKSSSHPRRIEWTGERCVPWSDDLQVIYEHYQRYLFVAPLANGRRVLDLASGEGYGTSILASGAQSVLGLDIDKDSVLHASETYQAPNVAFQLGDMLDLSALEDGSFDLVVCFEALEHVEDHKGLLDGVTRILRPGGTFVVSTPDRLTYTEELGQVNPFHVHELSRDEFEQMLSGRFRHFRIWGQNVSVGSLMMPLEAGEGSGQMIVLTHEEDQWRAGAKLDPTYLVAIASDAELADLPSYSTLIDPDLELIRTAMRQRDESRQANESLDQRLRQARAEVDRRRRDELALRSRVEVAENELARVQGQLERTVEHAGHLEVHRSFYLSELERLKASRSYRVGGAITGVAGRALPAGSARRAVGGVLKRQAKSILRPQSSSGSTPASPSPFMPPSSVPRSVTPRVSIVIPIHNGWELTAKCLWALVTEKSKVPYEVIVVDDASTDETARLLTMWMDCVVSLWTVTWASCRPSTPVGRQPRGITSSCSTTMSRYSLAGSRHWSRPQIRIPPSLSSVLGSSTPMVNFKRRGESSGMTPPAGITDVTTMPRIHPSTSGEMLTFARGRVCWYGATSGRK